MADKIKLNKKDTGRTRKSSKPEPMTDEAIVKYVIGCREEAKNAKTSRMDKNREAWRMYNLEYDFSHKTAGQHKEILSKLSSTVDKFSLFFQQAITDISDWWDLKAKKASREDMMQVQPSDLYKLTNAQLEAAGHYSIVGKEAKMGALTGVVITKVTGKHIPAPEYVPEKDDNTGSTRIKLVEKFRWQLCHKVVDPENFYPDPHAGDDERLKYEIEDIYANLSDIKKLSKKGKDKEPIYIESVVKNLKPWGHDEKETHKKEKTNHDTTAGLSKRARVKLTEFWGDIEDAEGNILYENCVCVVANDQYLIRRPTENPQWDKESPYVMTGLLEGLDTRWPKALMDAAVKHNKSLIELFNLILDGASAAAQNIKVLRKNYVSNLNKFQKGIPQNAVIIANEDAPPGVKVLEAVQSGNVPQDALAVYNLLNQEYNASAVDSDLRSGVTPFRQVKATEVFEQSQSITNILNGIVKNYEEKHQLRKLKKSANLIAQRFDSFEEDEIVDLLGETAAGRIGGLSAQQRFVEVVSGMKFEVNGFSRMLKKSQDFQKYAQLYQLIGNVPVFQEVLNEEIDPKKLVKETIETLGIRYDKIKRDEQEIQNNQTAPDVTQLTQQLPNEASQVQSPQNAETSGIAQLLGSMG